VTKHSFGDAKKAINIAVSFGVPTRFTGVRAMPSSWKDRGVVKNMPAAIKPGATQFTAIPWDILLRQCKYLNNIVERDHRAIKRITRPMLGFKSFWSARIIIAGIETMHMIRKGQLDCRADSTMSAANQFYTLAI